MPTFKLACRDLPRMGHLVQRSLWPYFPQTGQIPLWNIRFPVDPNNHRKIINTYYTTPYDLQLRYHCNAKEAPKADAFAAMADLISHKEFAKARLEQGKSLTRIQAKPRPNRLKLQGRTPTRVSSRNTHVFITTLSRLGSTPCFRCASMQDFSFGRTLYLNLR